MVQLPIVDPYDDDFAGLKAFFKDKPMPDFMKEASLLSREDLSKLPDHIFAVVMVHHGDPPLRKFACVDAAHSAANVIYFLANGDRLPFAVREKVATNLVLACQRFHLLPPAPLVKAAQRRVLIKTDGAPIFVSRTKGETKTSEVSGTSLAPISAPPVEEKSKKASVGFMEDPYVILGPMPARVKQAQVDPSLCALDDGRLPIATYAQVKEACTFFQEQGLDLHPRMRHQVAVKIANRAEDLGVETPCEIRLYSGQKFSSPATIKAAFMLRKRVWGSIDATGNRVVTMEKVGGLEVDALYDALLEKRAEMDPETFAESLAELDTIAGLDMEWGRIPDPWQTVFTKVAETPRRWRWVDGPDYLTEEDLLRLVAEQKVPLKRRFGEALLEGLTKDTVSVFESLPLPTKRAISHMAGQNRDGSD